MSDDVTNLAEVLRDADELAYANVHANWARVNIARTILASDWLAERDATNRLAGEARAHTDAIAAYAELVERVEALAAKWDEDRLTYPTEIDERAQFAEIAVRLCGEELRALIDPEATS